MWTPTYRKFRDTLVAMCRMTSPHGCEPYVWPHLPSPPHGAAPRCSKAYREGSTQIDRYGNYIVKIPGETTVKTMWTAHCDTADDHPTLVNMKWRDDMLCTDGKSILGADDKVGCAIMSMMIRAGCPGTYVFFQGEEVGCKGSSEMADDTQMLEYDCCISLDRKGYNSIITKQAGSRCCSDTWATQLAEAIKSASDGSIDLAPDPTGIFTDSREFVDIIPECTNISVGYFNQHTHSEHTNVPFAYALCLSLIKVAHQNAVPAPMRDIVNNLNDMDDMFKLDDDAYNINKWLRNRRQKYGFTTDPDFMTENEWNDWKDAL